VLVALVDGGVLPLASLDGVPVGAGELAAARAALRAYDAVLNVDDSRGGLNVDGVPVDVAVPGLLRRERTTLVNDVWLSHDEGLTWDFTNPGCWGAGSDASGGQVPMNTIEYQQWPGTPRQACRTDADCYAQAFGPSVACVANPRNNRQRMCVCTRLFSPREHAAVAGTSALTQIPAIYVTGGVGLVQASPGSHGSNLAVSQFSPSDHRGRPAPLRSGSAL
jgi:hypothetical protein